MDHGSSLVRKFGSVGWEVALRAIVTTGKYPPVVAASFFGKMEMQLQTDATFVLWIVCVDI